VLMALQDRTGLAKQVTAQGRSRKNRENACNVASET
jgi:hypothetical protein